MAEYDAEKLKWAGCEMKEWVKGADGTSCLLFILVFFLTVLACLKTWLPSLVNFWISYVPFVYTRNTE